MAFTVSPIEPPLTTGLLAGDTIQASSLLNMVKRDRFLFATRRRMIASLPAVITTGSATYQIAYGLQASLLASANGTILIGVIASDDCDVRVTTSYGAVTVSTGGPGCYIDEITGIPPSTWFSITVEVRSNTGSAVAIYGIYIAEAILTAADLP